MTYLSFFQNFNKLFDEAWPFILVIFISIIILIFLLYFGYKFFYLLHKNNKFKKNNLENEELIKQELGIFMTSLNFKIITIKYVKNTPNKVLAWKALIEILTKVVSNTFDEYGSEKGVLNSTYEMFKNLRNDMKENIGAIMATKVLLTLLNKTLRTFLAKWNKLINEQNVFFNSTESNLNLYSSEIVRIDLTINDSLNELIDNNLISNLPKKDILDWKKEFKSDYDDLLNEIKSKKYIQSLGHLCGVYLKDLKKYTDKR